MFWAPYWKGDTSSALERSPDASAPKDRRRARRGRGARLGAYRGAAGAQRAGHPARGRRRLLDRLARRRLLRRGQARHARSLRPLADPAADVRPDRFLLRRRRADRRRAPARQARGGPRRPPDRGPADPVRRRRDRDRRGARNLAAARPAGRGDPGVLRAAGRVRAGPDRGPLDVRRRDRQSGAGQRRPRARRRAGDRVQHFERQRRARHGDPGSFRSDGAAAARSTSRQTTRAASSPAGGAERRALRAIRTPPRPA